MAKILGKDKDCEDLGVKWGALIKKVDSRLI
jgi:hypothetical protein